MPEVAITPVASGLEYPAFNIVGKDINPIVTTVAPTIPVEAANNAPTATTETAKPPGAPPKSLPIEVNNSSAILDLSKAIPISTNNGTAKSVSF